MDKTTGVYTGTSRSYFFGLEGASGFDSASSFMQITNKPDAPATISYRMSYFNSGDSTGKNGITFGGTDIPVQQFADAFNSGAKSFEAAISAVGPIGARTLAPSVGVSTDGDRYSINIAAFAGHLGLRCPQGNIGQFAEAALRLDHLLRRPTATTTDPLHPNGTADPCERRGAVPKGRPSSFLEGPGRAPRRAQAGGTRVGLQATPCAQGGNTASAVPVRSSGHTTRGYRGRHGDDRPRALPPPARPIRRR